nr:hypothetical protein GCM10020092_018830 [Actinoplanes digitatis]
MPDGERLALSAEEDLLVGDQARRPHGVDPHAVDLRAARTGDLVLGRVRHRTAAGLGPGTGDQPRRVRRRAARRVQLARVVLLDDLDGLEVAGRLRRELHHQHRADAEVRGDQHADPGLV